jgi:hypothetical protein
MVLLCCEWGTKWRRSEGALGFLQVQYHFLVTLLKFLDMRDSFRYMWMAFFWLTLFRHLLILSLSGGAPFLGI